MKVLGVHSLTHDSGAALCEEGKITYAVEEERLSRIKHHPGIEVGGTPPYHAVQYVLKESGLETRDVDLIVHTGWPGDDFMRLDLIRRLYRDFSRELDKDLNKTLFVDHHLSHAASAYYASGFNDALTVVIDGAGDWNSTSAYLSKNRKLEKVDEYFLDQSLGFMYSRAAKLLGFGNFGFGEGKLTALASYGTPTADFRTIVTLENGRYKLNPDYYENFKRFKRGCNSELTEDHQNFAALVQHTLGNTVLYLLDNLHEK
ncbi:MAG: hypothetical protein HZC29_00770 [Thaumarchaeota archaeon]|nr:hypothetical protein [Nitrososphaerota archaeon]